MNISLISDYQTSTMWPSFPPPAHHSFSMSTLPFYCLPLSGLRPVVLPAHALPTHLLSTLVLPTCPTTAHLSFPLGHTFASPATPLPPPFIPHFPPFLSH